IPDPMCYSKANRFYYVEITDSNGCKSQEAVFITVNDLPFASVGNDKSICFGDSVWIGGDPSGPAGASFEWTPATGLDGVLKPNPNAKPDTSTTYSLTVTNQEGCTRLRKMRVTVNDLPSLEVIELPSYLCDGDTQNLYVTAGLSSYSWSPSEKLSRSDRATTSVFIDETTMFNVVGEDENGCKNSISFTLPVEEKPFVNIRGNLEMCIGDTVQFDAKADTGTLSWEPADLVDFSDSLNPKAFPTNVTTFTLNIMSDLGCRNKDEALVFVHQLPIADAGEDTDNCDMSVVYVGSDVPTTDENEWFWSPGEKLDNPTALRPKVLSLDTDTFVLSVTSPEGCFNSDTIVVNSDCYRHIYAPNAFTPDGDGYNDFFKIVGRNIYNTHLVIYDRWGHVLFQSKDLERGWDGKDQVKGNDVQIGAYFWQMTFETEMGRQLSDKGKVNLIR
ncbi:MAG: gliding motility-associated C-terminal domain-containing protein, partial [Salibacteraceae bacterium]